ncbi:MAG: MCE family protein [Planctomycetes bacterium]|nr:MCE family protein [Planctomycetota bacterium]
MEQLRYLLGVLTLIAVGIGGWFVFRLLTEEQLSDRFHVTVRFGEAHGLRIGADVRYRGVRVGEVLEVAIADDDSNRVGVRLAIDPRHVPAHDSRFWIVAPRFEGLTDGATGLDTLVRDPYVAYYTPTRSGPELGPNSVVIGDERPFVDPTDAGLEPERHGDLRMTLHAHETYGLSVGDQVRFRGICVGDVRSVDLSKDGDHVVIALRITQRHRNTVTDASAFWVARPRLSGALMSGLSIDDLEAMLSPYVGYRTEPGRGVPVADGHRAIASDAKPAVDEPSIQVAALEAPVDPIDVAVDGLQLVEVVYEAVEQDWWTPNDRASRHSSGVLFIDADGRYVVATVRTGCDAAFFMRDVFSGAPDIISESWSVAIPGGAVVRAGRSWIASDKTDLALLVLEQPPRDLPFTEPSRFDFGDEPEGEWTIRTWETEARPFDPKAPGPVDENRRGAVVMRGGRIVGLLGQVDGVTQEPVVVPLQRLPVELRPGS